MVTPFDRRRVGVACPEVPTDPLVLLGHHPQPPRSVQGVDVGADGASSPPEDRLPGHGCIGLGCGLGEYTSKPRLVAVVRGEVQLGGHVGQATRRHRPRYCGQHEFGRHEVGLQVGLHCGEQFGWQAGLQSG